MENTDLKRSFLRFISNNRKEQNHQTTAKAETNSGFRGLSRAVFFLLFNNDDFPCMKSNI